MTMTRRSSLTNSLFGVITPASFRKGQVILGRVHVSEVPTARKTAVQFVEHSQQLDPSNQLPTPQLPIPKGTPNTNSQNNPNPSVQELRTLWSWNLGVGSDLGVGSCGVGS